MTSPHDNTVPDAQPHIGADTEPDLRVDHRDDQESDPARKADASDGWTDEGGATPDGPATADD